MTARKLLEILAISAVWVGFATDSSVAQSKTDTSIPNLVPGPCPQGATPNLLIPLDGTFSVVNFNGAGCSGPASGGDPCQRNDDDVTASVALAGGWLFSLYNVPPTNTVFINNNGNVTLGVDFCTFTAVGFPDASIPPMVAPFWGDVDTRNLTSGVVYVRNNPGQLVVIWDHVGYYNQHVDLLNTFQMILTDGNDPTIGLGNNIAFCYGDMQWTTGDASGGIGGFGGTAATVGANAGDGVNFFQIGRFDAPGVCYDGPGGADDCVSFLDRNCFAFNAGGSNNVAPIYLNPPANCLQVKVGSTLNYTIEAIGPENNQTVTIAVNSGGLANFSSVEAPGNPASSMATFTPDCSQAGQSFNVTYTATDNFNPAGSTQLIVCIDVTLSPPEEFCPGDTLAACPCGNPGAAGNGCANSAFPGGAHLAAVGDPCLGADTIAFTATGVRPSTLALLFQGSSETAGNPVNDGNICVSGNVKRLWIWKNQFSSTLSGPGSTTMPDTTGITVSQRSAARGDTILSGSTRTYQVWYRDSPSFACAFPSNTNYTSGIRVLWVQ
ncbi:MAG: nidogen-like domain-containing protein [Planctomycetota bacterium]